MNAKKDKVIGNILFWLTLISPMFSFVLATEFGEVHIFSTAGIVRYSWIMLLFIPFGILLILIGKKVPKLNIIKLLSGLKDIWDTIEGGNMIKYFYLVTFEYQAQEDYIDSFDLGVFSTKKKALEKLNMSINLPGFNQYGIDNFKIEKFGVTFDENIKSKSNIILYCVEHEYENKDDGFSYYCIFDYFPSSNKANLQVEYLRKHSRLGKTYPNNFEVIEVKVDNFNDWSEGFDKLDQY